MDHFIHWMACAVIVTASILRMNAMHWRETPKVEIAAWWATAMGAFSQFFWVDLTPGWPDVFLVTGVAILVVLNTQPQWRRWIADRRGGPLSGCYRQDDRRSQVFGHDSDQPMRQR